MRLGRIAIFFALIMGVMAFSPAQDIKQAGETKHNGATQHNAAPSEPAPAAIGPMQGLFPYWKRYRGLAPKDHTLFRYAFYIERDDDHPPEKTSLWFMQDGKRIMISIAPDGRLVTMPDSALYKANPMMWTTPTIHAGTGEVTHIALHGVLELKTSLSTSMEVAALRMALDQVTASFRIMLGLKGLVIQGPQWIVFYFAGPAPKAEAVFPDSRRVPLLVEGNKVYFRPKDKRWKGASRLDFGEAPHHARFE